MFNITQKDSTQWLPVSDLMSGLMIIFLFISLAYVEDSQQVSKEYNSIKKNIANEMEEKLTPYLEEWNAQLIDSTLTIRFFSDDQVLFEKDNAKLSPHFEATLQNFFTPYLQILEQNNTCTRVEELRIEGHSSSEGGYTHNMILSQNRANEVLFFLLKNTPLDSLQKEWLQTIVSANGMATKQPIFDENGQEDVNQSRRVEFRLVLQSL